MSSEERCGRRCSCCNDVCLNWLFAPHHIVRAIHTAPSGSSSATSTYLFVKSVRSCIERHFIFLWLDVQPFLNSYSTIFTVFEKNMSLGWNAFKVKMLKIYARSGHVKVVWCDVVLLQDVQLNKACEHFLNTTNLLEIQKFFEVVMKHVLAGFVF